MGSGFRRRRTTRQYSVNGERRSVAQLRPVGVVSNQLVGGARSEVSFPGRSPGTPGVRFPARWGASIGGRSEMWSGEADYPSSTTTTGR
jgi:hypothetical protein